MPLINCKAKLSFSWDPNCIFTSLDRAPTFTITDAKCYVPIVTLSIENNTKLSKLLSKGFKRLGFWNKYKVILNKKYNTGSYIRQFQDASYQGIKRLFVLAYNNAADSHKKYFLPRVKIEN